MQIKVEIKKLYYLWKGSPPFNHFEIFFQLYQGLSDTKRSQIQAPISQKRW